MGDAVSNTLPETFPIRTEFDPHARVEAALGERTSAAESRGATR